MSRMEDTHIAASARMWILLARPDTKPGLVSWAKSVALEVQLLR